jgi:hypothetical protein
MEGFLREWKIPSSTNPNTTYTVKRWPRLGSAFAGPEGYEFSCNCKGWTMKRASQDRKCTHTISVKTLLAMEKPTTDTPAKETFVAPSGNEPERKFRI